MLQFHPFYVISKQDLAIFRRATFEIDENAVARQISVVFEEAFFTRDQKLITRAQFRPFYVICRQNCAKFWRASLEIVLSPNFVVFF